VLDLTPADAIRRQKPRPPGGSFVGGPGLGRARAAARRPPHHMPRLQRPACAAPFEQPALLEQMQAARLSAASARRPTRAGIGPCASRGAKIAFAEWASGNARRAARRSSRGRAEDDLRSSVPASAGKGRATHACRCDAPPNGAPVGRQPSRRPRRVPPGRSARPVAPCSRRSARPAGTARPNAGSAFGGGISSQTRKRRHQTLCMKRYQISVPQNGRRTAMRYVRQGVPGAN
jgi:hypothetical protein